MTAPTAGRYLRIRREAAGLSIADVAKLISASNRWARFNAIVIDLTEQDGHVPTSSFIDRLRTGFAFDRFVYRQLLCHLQPQPRICLTCGCSDLDACDDEIHGPCSWATPAHDLCTQCARRSAGDTSPTIFHKPGRRPMPGWRLDIRELLEKAAVALDKADDGGNASALREFSENLATLARRTPAWDEFAQLYCLTRSDSDRGTGREQAA